MRLYHPTPFKLTPVAEACAAFCWWLGHQAQVQRERERMERDWVKAMTTLEESTKFVTKGNNP